MANQSPKPQGQAPTLFYRFDGPAFDVPLEQRIRPKKLVHLDDPAIPRSHWYLTAGLMIAALTLGLLLGRFLLG
jgi:hypothetical protein